MNQKKISITSTTIRTMTVGIIAAICAVIQGSVKEPEQIQAIFVSVALLGLMIVCKLIKNWIIEKYGIVEKEKIKNIETIFDIINTESSKKIMDNLGGFKSIIQDDKKIGEFLDKIKKN